MRSCGSGFHSYQMRGVANLRPYAKRKARDGFFSLKSVAGKGFMKTEQDRLFRLPLRNVG